MLEAPWDYVESDGQPYVLFQLLGYPVTDQFLVTFVVFSALALLFWAFFEWGLSDDGSGAG